MQTDVKIKKLKCIKALNNFFNRFALKNSQDFFPSSEWVTDHYDALAHGVSNRNYNLSMFIKRKANKYATAATIMSKKYDWQNVVKLPVFGNID